MVTDEQLTFSATMVGAFLKQGTFERSFSRRINERIERLEARKTKSKYDKISLSVIISFILATCILIVLEITLDIFPGESDFIAIPVILLGVLIIIGVIFTVEYFKVKKMGEHNLIAKLGSLNLIKKEVANLQIENTKIYNIAKEAYKSVEKIDSRFILDSLILRSYLNLIQKELTDIQPEKLYHYLFYISIKKKIDVSKLLSTEEDSEKTIKIIRSHLVNYNKILTEFINIESLPNYFIDCANRSKEFINNFHVTN